MHIQGRTAVLLAPSGRAERHEWSACMRRVAIWGCGPVGILAAHSADFKGAERIVMIDNQQYRLEFAKKKIPRVETINFDEEKDVRRLQGASQCLLSMCSYGT